MDSSVSPKEEIWFLRVCHHISNAVYHGMASWYLGHVIAATLQGRRPVSLASCASDVYHVRILLCSVHVRRSDKWGNPHLPRNVTLLVLLLVLLSFDVVTVDTLVTLVTKITMVTIRLLAPFVTRVLMFCTPHPVT